MFRIQALLLLLACLLAAACRSTEAERGPVLQLIPCSEPGALDPREPGFEVSSIPAHLRADSVRLRLARAEVGSDELGWPAPHLEVHEDDLPLLEAFSQAHIGRSVCAAAGGRVLAVAALHAPLGASFFITLPQPGPDRQAAAEEFVRALSR